MSASQKEKAVQWLQDVIDYEYTGPEEEFWRSSKGVYADLKTNLENLPSTDTGKELSKWQEEFSRQNRTFAKKMGVVQYEASKGPLFPKTLVDTPRNKLNDFVRDATQQCDTLVKDLLRLRRNLEKMHREIDENVARAQVKMRDIDKHHALRLMRACIDAF